jgi:hypothetical protein
MERVKGIEPSPQAWEARVLPLNYTRFATWGEASEGRIRFKVQVSGVPSFQIPVPSSQKPEARSQKPEARSQMPEARGMRRVGAPGLQGEFSVPRRQRPGGEFPEIDSRSLRRVGAPGLQREFSGGRCQLSEGIRRIGRIGRIGRILEGEGLGVRLLTSATTWRGALGFAS